MTDIDLNPGRRPAPARLPVDPIRVWAPSDDRCNFVEVIGGRPPITVEQYTAAARAWFESDGQYATWASVTDELRDARTLATS
jgi:hypothetical protein